MTGCRTKSASAEKSSRRVVVARAQWELTVLNTQNQQEETLTCGFVHMCTGYYNYEQGHRPAFPGEKNFKGLSSIRNFGPKTLIMITKKS